MGRYKFPGKPTKHVNKKRVNVLSCPSTKRNETSIGYNETSNTFDNCNTHSDNLKHTKISPELNMQETQHGKSKNKCNAVTEQLKCTNVNNTLTENNKSSDCERLSVVRRSNKSNSFLYKNYHLKHDNSKSARKRLLRKSSELRIVSKTDGHESVSKKLTACNTRRSLYRRKKKIKDKSMTLRIHDRESTNLVGKFVLPSKSLHSSRVIIPNKRFINSEQIESRRNRKPKVDKIVHSNNEKVESSISRKKHEVKNDQEVSNVTEFCLPKESTSKDSPDMVIIDSTGSTTPKSCSKLVLRKARLQLRTHVSGDMDGPFSSSYAASTPNPPGTVTCGVCGAVRFYRFVKQARKFNIYSCESCRKFISKMIKRQSCAKNCTISMLVCHKGQGMCHVPPIVRSQQWKLLRCAYKARCPACWLKMCLQSFQMPSQLKLNLTKMLPENMRVYDNYNTNDTAPNINHGNISQENFNTNDASQSTLQEQVGKVLESSISPVRLDILSSKTDTLLKDMKNNEKYQKPRTRIGTQKKNVILSNKESSIANSDCTKRQKIDLKGPRVKHVCRSASIVLGQPIATFAREYSPSPDDDIEKDRPICEDPSETDACINCNSVSKDACASAVRKKCSAIVTNKSNHQKVSVENSIVPLSTNEIATVGSSDSTDEECLQDKVVKHLLNPVISISTDYFDNYDSDNKMYSSGFGLIGSEPFAIQAVCFYCGSAGQEQLLYCACCCEPYHYYCINDNVIHRYLYNNNVTQPNVDVNTNFNLKLLWKCSRCSICYKCGQSDKEKTICQLCHQYFHPECMQPDWNSPSKPTICSLCLRCEDCGSQNLTKLVCNVFICLPCFKLRMQEKHCSSCQIFDENSKYVKCGICLNIIHAECEKLTDEMYEIIHNLPLSSTYFCSTCSFEKKLSWKESVNTALKNGFHIVLRLLIRNPSAKDILKWNLFKNLNCSCGNETTMKRILYSNNNDFDIGSIESNMATVLNDCHSESSLDKSQFNIYDNMNEEKQNKDNKFDISLKNIRKKFCIKECSVRIKNCLESKRKNLSNIVKIKECDKNSLKKYEEKNNFLTNVEFNNVAKSHCSKHILPIFLLLNIKKNINTNIYKTVKEFHSEVQQALKKSLCHELLKFLDTVIKDIFPWYNPQTLVYNETIFFNKILINESTSNTHTGETSISSRNEKLSTLLKENVERTVTNKCVTESKIDTRICVLCHKIGDGSIGFEGRLLYCGQDEWIHVNCAFWSSEVYEEIDCSLQNIQDVISNSRKTHCSFCKESGASISCSIQSCSEVFHYICARTTDCCFLTNNTVCCLSHYDPVTYKIDMIRVEDFDMQRPIYIKIDLKKNKHIELSKVQYLIGCLNVTSLGTFFPALSDTEEAIIPSEFVCSRLFWSITEPWKIVRYTINTSILIPTLQDLEASENNFIVDHVESTEGIAQKVDILKRNKLEYGKYKNTLLNSKDYDKDSINITDDDKIVLQVLENLLELICSKELEDTCDDEPQNAADILPPELKDAIFEDLPHDLLDGISVQDIFPKLMSYEDIISADLKISDSIDSGESVKSNSSTDSSHNELKSRKADLLVTGSDLWLEPKYSIHSFEDYSQSGKDVHGQHLKRSKSEVFTGIKKISRTCNHQRSCSLTWSCKLDNTRPPSTKKRKLSCTPKSVADISNNLFMLVDGNNDKNSMLQELRLPDSVLMSVGHSTNVDCLSDSVRELKYCLEENQEIEHEKENNCRAWRNKPQSRIVQLDGADDSSSENESSNEMDSNVSSVIKSNDEPVKCDKCHCTYRTLNSYKKHLTICASMSSSESDSENEEKAILPLISNPGISNTLNKISNGIVNGAIETVPVTESPIVNTENNSVTQDINIMTNNYTMSCSQSVCIPPNNTDTKKIDTDSSAEFKENVQTSVQVNQYVVNNTEIVTSTISNIQRTSNEISSLTSFVENTTQKLPISKMTAVKKVTKQRNNVKPKSVLIASKNKKIPVKRNRTDKSVGVVNYNTPQNNTNRQIRLPDIQSNTVGGPTIIIQHLSSPNLMPAYVEAFQQQTGQNLQCIATIVPNDYKSTPFITSNSFIPGGFQMQTTETTNVLNIPTESFSVIPGLDTISQSRPVLGTFVQNRPTTNFQCGMVSTEQVFLGSVPSVEPVVNDLQNSLFLSSSPIYYGFEAIVQNTVMQSQQFVSSTTLPGVLSSNSYSATTTQVFQSSKLEPIVDMNGTSYIVVNPQVPQVPAPITVNSHQLLAQFENKQNSLVQQPQHLFESSSPTAYPVQIVPVNDSFVPVVKPVLIEQVQSQIEPVVACVKTDVINPLINKEPYVNKSMPPVEITVPLSGSLSLSDTENKIPTNIVTPTPQIAPSQVLKPTNRVLPMQTQPPKSPTINNKVIAVEPPNILNKLSQTVDKIQETLQNDAKSLQSIKFNSNKNQLLKLESASLKLVFQKQSEDGIYKISNKYISKKKVPIKIAPVRKSNVQPAESMNNTKNIAPKELIEPKIVNKIILPKPDDSPKLLYKMQSQDGFDYSSTSLTELWKNVFNAVQSARAVHKIPLLPEDAFNVFNGLQLLGLNSNGLRYLIEQLPGAGTCTKYKPIRKKIKYPESEETNDDKTFRAARCEPYVFVKQPYDMFSWLASEHRNPDYIHQIDNDYACRRASSVNLPMAMRFRQLKETSKQTVGVYRSGIHGRGLFCLRDIECGEMVIEYAGEVIRSTLTDKREKYYNSKGIGCYMFRVDDHFVIDATMKGNAARFINHSCDPNCYSRVLEILGHKHILIFALRKIIQGEELTYDYKFPFEEDKIPCTCGAKRCRKYLN